MGQRGPAPIPTEVKAATGRRIQPAREQARAVVLAPKVDGLEAPSHLTLRQLKKWNELVSELQTVPGLLSAVDGPAVMMAVVALDVYETALEQVNRDGPVILNTITGGVEQFQEHPALKTMDRMATMYFKACSRFGLTPSDRTGMGIQALQRRKLADDVQQRIGSAQKEPELALKAPKTAKTRRKRAETPISGSETPK